MEPTLDLTIPIAVEFGATLRPLAGTGRAQAFASRVAADVGALLARLGLVGEPTVEVRAADADRAVRVRVHGVVQPYAPVLLQRLWAAVAPPKLHALLAMAGPAGQTHFPDGWLREYAARLDPDAGEADLDLAYDYLARLIVEIIQGRAWCLVSPAQAAAYSDDTAPGASPAETLLPLLRSLLGLGVSVADKAVVVQTAGIGETVGRSLEDTLEAAFARLRSDRIDIHVHPGYLAALAPGLTIPEPTPVYAGHLDGTLQDLFSYLEDGMATELGILLPVLVLAPAPGLPDSCFAVTINDQPGLPTRGPQAGEVFVNESVDQLSSLGIAGQPALNPGTRALHTMVAEEHKARLEELGYTTWTASGFLILALAGEIKAAADRLLSVEDMEGRLAWLEPDFPDLVRLTGMRVSTQDLTRVLRGLLREGLSVRNLRAILERLLQFDTVAASLPGHLIFDDRLVVAAGTPPGTAGGWPNLLEFVRQGLRRQLGHIYARGTETLVIYLLDGQIGDLLERRHPAQAHEPGLDEDTRDAILEAIWAEIAHLPPTAAPPGILAPAGVRAALRDLISAELPQMFVVDARELPPGLNIQPVARIALGA